MPDFKVVPFQNFGRKSADNDEVIRLLIQALEHAKNGGSHSVAVVLIDDTGNAIDCWHNGGRPYAVVGALEALKTEFILANIERR